MVEWEEFVWFWHVRMEMKEEEINIVVSLR